MSDFRFIHAADLHLDTPFQGIARTAPGIARAMRDASLEAWDALVDWTIEEGAAFLLLAGDIYDGAERGVRAQLRFRSGLERLSIAGIPCLIVHGNHDPLSGWSAIHEWPEGVTVFGADRVESVPVMADGSQIATVHGISYGSRDVTENLALRFTPGSDPGLQIGLLHCNVGQAEEHAPYSPCTLDQLREIGMHYWALGHVHTRKTWTVGTTHVVYPGNLQGRSPQASERNAKGAVAVEVVDGRVADVRFRALDRIRFHNEQLDVSGCEDVFTIKAALLERARVVRDQHGERGVILVATLLGRTSVHPDLVRSGTLDAMLEELREEFIDDEPFLWWDHLKLRTRSPLDVPAIRGRDDFLGALLRHADSVVADPDALDGFIERHQRALFSQRLPAEVLNELDAVQVTEVDPGSVVPAATGTDEPERDGAMQPTARLRRKKRRPAIAAQPSLFAPAPKAHALVLPLVDPGGDDPELADPSRTDDQGQPADSAGPTGNQPDGDSHDAATESDAGETELLRRAAERALDALTGTVGT